jgi:hypothetical protein
MGVMPVLLGRNELTFNGSMRWMDQPLGILLLPFFDAVFILHLLE